MRQIEKNLILIRKKYHKKIASLLLGCMLIVGMPFHEFLHQHTHTCDTELSSRNDTEFSIHTEVAEIAVHSCVACSINQLAHTLFIKAAEFSFIFSFSNTLLAQRENNRLFFFTIATESRAPPVSFL